MSKDNTYIKYRKIQKDYRDWGLGQFIKVYPNTPFDPTNKDHLNWVISAANKYKAALSN